MIKHEAIQISKALRSAYPDDFGIHDLFSKVGEVSDYSPNFKTGGAEQIFSFKETGKSTTRKKEDVFALTSKSDIQKEVDSFLAEIISEII